MSAHFVILAADKPGALELRMANRPDHLEYLNSLGIALKVAGPFLDPDGKSIGTMAVVAADDQAAAEAIAANDPYAKAGVFASVEVRPWRVGVGGFSK
jgi:uncharacterized protein YciI